MVIKELSLYFIILLAFTWVNGRSSSLMELDTSSLAKVKKMIHNETAPQRTQDAYLDLLIQADALLTTKNPTVIDKTIAPKSSDLHDYLSLSRYWWPNPETEDGLPWIRKDGITNPFTQSEAADRKRLGMMTDGVEKLSLAYYFSEEERYAEKATSMLATWFLDDSTKMTPNLQFAQSVPGIENNRPYGILDGRSIALTIPKSLTILSSSHYWTKEHSDKMNQWLNKYLNWLIDSDLGQQALKLKNNHGSWYKFQVASLALYLDKSDKAREIVEITLASLDDQLNSDGGQIHELTRSKSFFYSCFNLEALTLLANIADKVGIDMWQYESADGKSIALAIRYVTTVLDGKEWSHPTLNRVDVSKLIPILVRMSNQYPSSEVNELLSRAVTIVVEREKETDKKHETLQELSLTTVIQF